LSAHYGDILDSRNAGTFSHQDCSVECKSPLMASLLCLQTVELYVISGSLVATAWLFLGC